MKFLPLMLLALLFSGCSSLQRIDSFVPPITAAEIHYARAGKFSNTEITVKNLRTEGDLVKAEEITLRHNNAWVPKFDVTVRGYQRAVKPEARGQMPDGRSQTSELITVPAAPLR